MAQEKSPIPEVEKRFIATTEKIHSLMGGKPINYSLREAKGTTVTTGVRSQRLGLLDNGTWTLSRPNDFFVMSIEPDSALDQVLPLYASVFDSKCPSTLDILEENFPDSEQMQRKQADYIRVNRERLMSSLADALESTAKKLENPQKQ